MSLIRTCELNGVNSSTAPKWLQMSVQPDPVLCKAIEERRMIRLLYHRRLRIVEPHDHGILNGSVQLLAYQVGGSSRRPLPNWILMKADEIVDLELLEQSFPGGRPTAADKHLKWNTLFTRVKPPSDDFKAGVEQSAHPLSW